MKILRLGISDDHWASLRDSKRSWHIAQEHLAAETGLSWQTELFQAWPYPSFAADVEKKLDELQPDLVFFCCAAYWVMYPSAPLAVHRSRIPLGKTFAKAGFWAASKPLIANRGLFHAARAAIVREANVAFFFEPAKALRVVEQVIRTVLRHEQIALAVRGPLPLNISGPEALRDLCEARRTEFDNGIAALCRDLHVQYLPYSGQDLHPADELLGDRVHVNAKGHASRASQEAELIVRAWRAHNVP